VKTKQGATWYAELLDDLPRSKRPAPFLEIKHDVPSLGRCADGLAIRELRPTIGRATPESAEKSPIGIGDDPHSRLIQRLMLILEDRSPNRTPGQAQGLNLSTLDLVGFCLQSVNSTP
jgi:hypothetical protein